MKEIDLIKNHLQQAMDLAKKVGFENAHNFDLEDFTYTLEGYVDELNDIENFEVYEDEISNKLNEIEEVNKYTNRII